MAFYPSHISSFGSAWKWFVFVGCAVIVTSCTPAGPDLVGDASDGDIGALKKDLAAHVDVNQRNDSGYTPLMISAANGHLEIVRALISARADVNARSKDEHTALMLAASGHPDIVRVLLDAGADPNARSKLGITALQEAAVYGEPLAAQSLLAAGADPTVRDSFGLEPLDYAVGKTYGSREGHDQVAGVLRAAGGRELRDQTAN